MNMNNHDQLSELDFSSFKRKVKATYNLDLEAYKRPQMERRLRANMDKCGAKTFGQYFSLMQSNEKLVEEFLDRVTINVSELFRNPDQFEVLRTRVLPDLLKNKNTLSVWSAGCSYGAEPYSIAVLLRECASLGQHSILATDIDDKMLARAQQGIFTEQEMRNVSKQRILKYFQKLPEDYAATNTLKQLISFRKHNLLQDPFRSGFDLIVCRNVVIYFTDEAKAGLYRRFYASLRPGGYLFVGGTERISEHEAIGYENTTSFFYRKPQRS